MKAPIIPIGDAREISAQEADELIRRARWPLDYSVHTSECGNVGDEESFTDPYNPMAIRLVAAALLVALCATVALLVTAL